MYSQLDINHGLPDDALVGNVDPRARCVPDLATLAAEDANVHCAPSAVRAYKQSEAAFSDQQIQQ